MSSPIRDCGEGWRSLGESLNEFLYEDGKRFLKGGKPGILKEHTKEELLEMLMQVHDNSWSNYNDIAEEMNWN